jgi:hypothetical protein
MYLNGALIINRIVNTSRQLHASTGIGINICTWKQKVNHQIDDLRLKNTLKFNKSGSLLKARRLDC